MSDVSNRNILVASSQTTQSINNIGQGLPKSEDVLAQCLSDLLQNFDVFFYIHASLNGIDYRDHIFSINGSGQVGFDRPPQREIFMGRYCQAFRNFSTSGDHIISALIQCAVKKGACVPPSRSGHYFRKIGCVLFKVTDFVIQCFERAYVLRDRQWQPHEVLACFSDDNQQIEIWIYQLVDLKSFLPQAQADQLSMSLFTGRIGPVHRENGPCGSRNCKNAGYEGLKLRNPVSPRVSTGLIGQRWSFTKYRRNNQGHKKNKPEKPHQSTSVTSRHVPSKTNKIYLLHLAQTGVM